jgi:phosphotransferase system enzyme I (PtsP)
VTRKQQKGLCLCGEMATDPAHFLLLLGMGIREFSMAAPFIPRIKALLRDLALTTAEEAAKKALTMTDSAQIRSYLQQVLNSVLAGS